MDAIIKAVYRSRQPDYVLKYEGASVFRELRAAFERLVR